MVQHDGLHERLILEALCGHRTMTMEELVAAIPEVSWNRLFHAIDRLSRGGHITVYRRGFEYELSMPRRLSESSTSAA